MSTVLNLMLSHSQLIFNNHTQTLKLICVMIYNMNLDACKYALRMMQTTKKGLGVVHGWYLKYRNPAGFHEKSGGNKHKSV